MRPNGEEVLRGVQNSLLTYILPEIQSDYARTELTMVQALLGIVAGEWDGAAQRLVDDNRSLRELARRGAEALASHGDAADLTDELRSLATKTDPSLRLSDLSAANGRLRDALGRLGVHLESTEAPALRELRAGLIERLRAEAQSRALPLLGPRTDG